MCGMTQKHRCKTRTQCKGFARDNYRGGGGGGGGKGEMMVARKKEKQIDMNHTQGEHRMQTVKCEDKKQQYTDYTVDEIGFGAQKVHAHTCIRLPAAAWDQVLESLSQQNNKQKGGANCYFRYREGFSHSR
jgi:uncharacterized protein (DUF1778 family)